MGPLIGKSGKSTDLPPSHMFEVGDQFVAALENFAKKPKVLGGQISAGGQFTGCNARLFQPGWYEPMVHLFCSRDTSHRAVHGEVV